MVKITSFWTQKSLAPICLYGVAFPVPIDEFQLISP